MQSIVDVLETHCDMDDRIRTWFYDAVRKIPPNGTGMVMVRKHHLDTCARIASEEGAKVFPDDDPLKVVAALVGGRILMFDASVDGALERGR